MQSIQTLNALSRAIANFPIIYECGCLGTADPEVLEGEGANTDGALMYHTKVDCGRRDIPCPPYVHQKELACAVCTK